jgi:2-polyprenyl-3-methyl-5-hydroxy-6-metoxy-1,4-benzoquinol methylase
MKNKLDAHVAAYQGENVYDFDNEILLNWYPPRIVANSVGAVSVLELGLGHGFSTEIFAKNFKRHLVLEGSPAVIENFRQKFQNTHTEIVETFFENFETEEKFDVVVMGFILEHVDDPTAIIKRFRKFLAPNGKLFIAVPNAQVLNRRIGHAAGLLDNMESLSDNDLLLGHKRYYTVETLIADIKDAGYVVDKMEGIYLKPFTTIQILSLNLSKDVIQALCKIGVDYPELSCGLLAKISAEVE